jgi:hypothetical protein
MYVDSAAAPQPMDDLQKCWNERIERAKKAREQWAKNFETQKGRDYWEGRQNPGYPEDEWITINKIYAHLQAQLPTLYSIDPYFYVKLKKSYQVDPQRIAEFEAKGRGRQAMLNYLKGELDLKSHARLAIQDAYFEFGVLKVRHASDSTKHPHAGEPILDEDGEEVKDPETGKAMVYPDTLPANERYELTRLHPGCFLWDADAGPLEPSWNWCGDYRVISKAEALEDPTFDKKAVRDAKGGDRSVVDRKDGDAASKPSGIISAITSAFSRKKDDEVFLKVWQIWDLKKREFLNYCETASSLFTEPRSCPPGVEKHPYSFLRFTLRDDSPYPFPPVSPALGPQKEVSLSRSRLMTHRKRFNRKYEVDVNKLMDADTELPKLESGDDGTIVRVMALGAVNPINDAPLDQQNLQELQFLNNDLVEVFGTPSSARGVADSDSATEASILDTRLAIREGDKLSMVKDFVITAASKLDMLVQFHIDKDEAVKVTGTQGEFWQVIKESDYEEIEGEYQYSVNVGASQPRLPEIERSQWIAFMSQVVIPFPQILTAPSVMRRMAEMFGIEDDAAIEELRQLGLKMMSGQMPMPGNQGGGPSNNPVSAIMGAAMGPMGGNTNGGGSPMAKQ